MFVDQSLYVMDFVHMYGFDDVRPTSTPTSGRPLSKDQMPVEQREKEAVSKHPYQLFIDSLHYLEQCTPLDINFAFNRLSRFQVNIQGSLIGRSLSTWSATSPATDTRHSCTGHVSYPVTTPSVGVHGHHTPLLPLHVKQSS